jgi:cellulose biosynthesis protein BcsQ
MIFISINSKGGVGKSTLANQILPAYLFLKN